MLTLLALTQKPTSNSFVIIINHLIDRTLSLLYSISPYKSEPLLEPLFSILYLCLFLVCIFLLSHKFCAQSRKTPVRNLTV